MANEATINTPVARSGTAVHPTLSMLGITKHYDAIAALTDVSFDVLPGEVHALLGENGAGKSTLMNVASGATAPDSGTIVFDGAPVRPASRRRWRRSSGSRSSISIRRSFRT